MLERAATSLRQHPFLVDSLLAGLLFLLTVGSATAVGADPFAGFAVTCLLVVPLAWRRRAPVAAGFVVLAGGLLELVVSEQFLVSNVAVLAMVYALAAYAPTWARRAGLAAGIAGAGLAALRYFTGIYYGTTQSFDGDTYANGLPSSIYDLQGAFVSAVAISVLVLASWALGSVRRSRLRHLTDLQDRARLLELEHDQEIRLAAIAERARIAREMHDVVAHSLSVVIAQADGGRYAGRTDAAAATAALETIADTGRQALADMRSLLGVLRDGTAAGGVHGQGGATDYSPQPDVAAVDGLVEDVRASGVDVDLIVEGAPHELAAGPQLAVYRIVQESLTNVLKHAGPATRAWVRLHWREEALELSVLDDGRGAAAALDGPEGTGHGLLGMRERAELHGGRLEAGPRPGGGFGVHAALPYRPRR